MRRILIMISSVLLLLIGCEKMDVCLECKETKTGPYIIKPIIENYIECGTFTSREIESKKYNVVRQKNNIKIVIECKVAQ